MIVINRIHIRISYIHVALCFLFGTLSSEILSSQGITYFNYLNYTSKWYYKMDWFGIGGYNGYRHDYLYIDGDTLIEGSNYYKVRRHFIQEQVNPTYGITEGEGYAYAIREDADSIFIYRYPDGKIDVFSNKASDWAGYSILYYDGELPHRVYWNGYSPIQGWIEGIGKGQIGGNYPYEPGYLVLQCYTRDSLSTTAANTPCEIEFFLTALEESKYWAPISIFPNPVSTSFYISGMDQNIDNFKIYSITGLLLANKKDISSKLPIDIHDFDPGMYIIYVNAKGKNYAGKFIVVH